MDGFIQFANNGHKTLSHSTVSAEWKNINKENLDSALSFKEGVERVTHLEGADAIAVADSMDQILDCHHLSDVQRIQYISVLRKLCWNSGIVPTSNIIAGGLNKTSKSPAACGLFADVWQGCYKGKKIAIKALKVSKSDALFSVTKRFCKEGVIWRRLSHPNILPFLGVSITTSPAEFWLVSPWLAHGNIKDYLHAHPDANRFLPFWDVTNGLSYLHSIGTVHGNIKATNVLIDDNSRACLAGFSSMTNASETLAGYTSSTYKSGTIQWMAPELLDPSKNGLSTCTPSKEADMYALGMLAYEFATGAIPFNQCEDAAVVSKVMKGIRPERPSDPTTIEFVDAVWPIVEKCWFENWKERPTASQVLKRLNQSCQTLVFSLPSSPLRSTNDPDTSLSRTPRDEKPRPTSTYSPAASQMEYGTQAHHSRTMSMPAPISGVHLAAPSEGKMTEEFLDSMMKTKEGLKFVKRLKGDEAISAANIIDKALDSQHTRDDKRNVYLKLLPELCGHSGILPTSHTIQEGLEKVGACAKAGGAYADVWEGLYKHRQVAIKALRVYRMDELAKVKKQFCKEVAIWKRLCHPNILPFTGVATSPFPFCLVSPWMVLGNLNEYIESYPRASRFHLFWDITEGLRYLHLMDIAHGNLKGANILINGAHRACLADFWLTTIMSDLVPGYSMNTMNNGGTIRWMAPELLVPDQYGFEKSTPSKESDIYALGMVVYEVITGIIPFTNTRNPEIVTKVLKGDRPSRPTDPKTINFTNSVWPVAEDCWREDLKMRPTISEIISRLSQSTTARDHDASVPPSPMDYVQEPNSTTRILSSVDVNSPKAEPDNTPSCLEKEDDDSGCTCCVVQ